MGLLRFWPSKETVDHLAKASDGLGTLPHEGCLKRALRTCFADEEAGCR